jgi:hypothetical protein
LQPDSKPGPIIRDPAEWRAWIAAQRFAARARTTARAAFLVSPDGFALAEQSARDNAYMASGGVDGALALRQHRALVDALSMSLPVQVFPGNADTPDAVFPNNVFATVPGRLIVGAMRHEVRRREAARSDLPEWFVRRQGYAVTRIDHPGVVAELTGPLIIDHARGIGYCGLSERVNAAGLAAMQAAFGLAGLFVFELVPGEYHTNVVMSVLAGRALVLHAASIADPRAVEAIAATYGDRVLWLSDAEKAAFVGNCLAIGEGEVWMSARAAAALSGAHRQQLTGLGFAVRSVDISEIEKAGGSLRCCIGEIW